MQPDPRAMQRFFNDEMRSKWTAMHTQIKSDIANTPPEKVHKGKIKHGDYGYFFHEGKKIVRLFLTKHGKVQAVDPLDLQDSFFGFDVNRDDPDKSQYVICGHLDI
jgi:hypothetical protein